VTEVATTEHSKVGMSTTDRSSALDDVLLLAVENLLVICWVVRNPMVNQRLDVLGQIDWARGNRRANARVRGKIIPSVLPLERPGDVKGTIRVETEAVIRK
jgi:hypothetical protein